MSIPWTCLWLDHMNGAMKATLPNRTTVQRRAALTVLFFWRHFLAFFPMTREERGHITVRLGGYAEHWVAR